MASNTTIKMIKLQSYDGEVFAVPETVARQSETIATACSKVNTDQCIIVPVGTAEVHKKVITYCEKHAVAEAAGETNTENEKAPEGSSSSTLVSDDELENWDKQLIDNVDAKMAYDLHLAAFYLKLNGLWELAQGKATEKIRDMNMLEFRTKLIGFLLK